jgi:cell division protein FtsL
MVVCSIICIISIFGVFSFLSNQNYTSLNQEISEISDEIKDYDKKIGNDISDYEFNFFK